MYLPVYIKAPASVAGDPDKLLAWRIETVGLIAGVLPGDIDDLEVEPEVELRRGIEWLRFSSSSRASPR